MATTRTRTATPTTDKPKRRATARRRAITPDDIAARAYAIFESEGGGNHVEHWLQAERELSAPAARRR